MNLLYSTEYIYFNKTSTVHIVKLFFKSKKMDETFHRKINVAVTHNQQNCLTGIQNGVLHLEVRLLNIFIVAEYII